MERKSFADLFQEEFRIHFKQKCRLIVVDQWKADAGEIGIYVRKSGERAGIYGSLSEELFCYQNGGSIEEVVKGYLVKWEMAKKEASSQKWRFFSEAGNHLFAGLLNRRWEAEHMVCYRLGDMIGICVLIYRKDKMVEIYLPDEGDLKNWDVTVESLWTIAIKNSQMQNPPMVTPLDWVVERIVEKELREDREKEEVEETLRLIREQPSKVPMYLLTNQDSIFGAVCMFDTEIMNQIAGAFRSDLILIPSSIHEILIVPCKEGEAALQVRSLEELLHGVSEEMLCKEELLSDFLYYYEWAAKRLTDLHNGKENSGAGTAAWEI